MSRPAIIFIVGFALLAANCILADLRIVEPANQAIVAANFPQPYISLIDDDPNHKRWLVRCSQSKDKLEICSFYVETKEATFDTQCYKKLADAPGQYTIRISADTGTLNKEPESTAQVDLTISSQKIEATILTRIVFFGESQKCSFTEEHTEVRTLRFGERELKPFFKTNEITRNYCLGCHSISPDQRYFALNFRIRQGSSTHGTFIYDLETSKSFPMEVKTIDMADVLLISFPVWFHNPPSRLAFLLILTEKGKKTFRQKYRAAPLSIYNIDTNEIKPVFDADGDHFFTELFALSKDDNIVVGSRGPLGSNYYYLTSFEFKTKKTMVLDRLNDPVLSSRDPYFSPDNRWIFFTRGDYRKLVQQFDELIDSTNDLYIADFHKGPPRALSCNSLGSSDNQPHLTQDMQWFIMVSNRRTGNESDMYVAKFDPEKGDCSSPVRYPHERLDDKPYSFNYPITLIKKLTETYDLIQIDEKESSKLK